MTGQGNLRRALWVFTMVAASATVFLAVGQLHANGTAYYFDVNGSTAGFGTPSGTYNTSSADWSTSSAGTLATVALASSAQMTFGVVASDFPGATFTINMNVSNTPWYGLMINGTSTNVTLNGTSNQYLVGTQTWTVAAGSTLTENLTWDKAGSDPGGLNFAASTLTLTGGGTINFNTFLGYNGYGGVVTLSGPVVNLNYGSLLTSTTSSVLQSGCTLTSGVLNFQTADSMTAFQKVPSGKHFAINGGVFDNTSASAGTLTVGAGGISLGGSSTFNGTNNLSFGTASVALTAASQVTVNNNTLAIPGPISGGYGLTKAGSGFLSLAGTNSYNGGTTLTAGELSISATSNLPTGGPVAFNGGILQITGAAVTSMAGYTVNWSSFNGGFDIANAANVFTVSNAISGSGGLTKLGSGLLSLGGTNSYNGGTTLTAGELSISSSSNLSAGGPVVFNGGILQITGAAVTSMAGYTVNWSSFNGGFDIANAANVFTVSNAISGSGGLTEMGSGLLSLTGTNSYSGSTIVNGGTLQLGNALTVQNSTVNVAPSGNVVFAAGVTSPLLGGLAGSGNFALQDAASNPVTLTVGNNNATTAFSGALTGSGSLTKVGSGNLALSGTNTYTGTTTVNAGYLQAATDASLGAAPAGYVPTQLTLNGGGLMNDGATTIISANRGITLGAAGGYLRCGFSGSQSLTINSIVAGSGALTIANDQGSVTLANTANSYSGATTIGNTVYGGTNGAASLIVANLPNGGLPSSIGSSSNLAANLVFSGGAATMTYSGGGDSTDRLFTLASNAAISASGTGPVVFTNSGAIAFSGTSACTLTLGGTGPGVNSFAPTLADNGAYPTILAVNGALWSLPGAGNTYTGGTVVNGGTLQLGNALAVQNSTVNVGPAGTLAFAAGVTSPVLGGLSGSGNIALQDAASNAVALTVGGNGANTVYAGALSGGTGLTKTGSGVLAVAAPQNYAGPTVINSGTLQIGQFAGSFSGFGGAGGTGWTLNHSGSGPAITVTSDNMATLTTSPSSGGFTTTNSMFYNSRLPVVGLPWTATFTYNDLLGGGANGGAFVLENASAGAGAIGLISPNGKGVGGVAPSAEVVWNIYANYGASDVDFLTGGGSVATLSTTASGVNITTANTPTNFTVSYNGASTLTLNLSQGTNNWSHTYTGVNLGAALGNPAGGLAYIGFTGADGGVTATQQVSNFSITYGGSSIQNLLPVNTLLQINAGGTFDLYGNVQTIGSLTGSGTVTNTAPWTAALTLGNDGTSQTFSGAIIGNVSLSKIGSGVQTLSGSSTYTGGTTVSAGTLVAAGNNPLGAGTVTLNPAVSAVLAFTGATPTIGSLASSGPGTASIVLGDPTGVNGVVALSVGGPTSTTFGGTISDLSASIPSSSGSLAKVGSGTLTLTGVNTFAGPLNINAGVLNFASASNLGGGTAAIYFNGGTLQYALGNNYDITTAPAVVTLNAPGGVIDTGGNNVTLSNSIGGAGGLTKIGAGTLVLGGSNAFAGPLNINAGVLNFASASNLGGGTAGIYFNGGTLQYAPGNSYDITTAPALVVLNAPGGAIDTGGNSVAFNNSIFGAGGLIKLGAGVLELAGANFYTGGTTISAGTLQLGSATGLPSGAAATVNGTLDLNTFSASVSSLSGSGTVDTIAGGSPILTVGSNNATSTFGGTIQNSTTGMLALQKIGSGLLSLAGTNTYSGGTTISAGTLQIGSSTGLPMGTAAMVNGTLDLNGFSDGVSSLSGSGIVDSVAGGTPTLTVGSGNFQGVLQNSAGSLALYKTTTGSLTLNGASTFAGGTTMNAGALVLANTSGSALGSGNLTLNGGTLAGATLGGTISGPVQAGSNAHTIAPGAGLASGQFGVLNLNGGLSGNANTTLLFNLNLNASSGTDGNGNNIYVGDLINLGGPGLSGSGNITFGVNPTQVGDYRLMGGTLGSPTLSDFTLPIPQTGKIYSLSTGVDPNYLDLVVTAVSGGTWNCGTGSWAACGNWSSGLIPSSGTVTFAGSGAPVTVTLDGNQSVGALAFNVSGSNGYTLSQGTGGGALTLGTSAAGASVSVITGTHEIDAPVVLAGSLVVTGSGTLTFGSSSSIADNGSQYALSLNGPGGTLILSGSDTYGGGTNVNAGTLIVTNNTALPSETSLTVGAGGTFVFDPSMVGTSMSNDSVAALRGAMVAAVPEPGTLVLLAVGALAALLGAWRKKCRCDFAIHPF